MFQGGRRILLFLIHMYWAYWAYRPLWDATSISAQRSTDISTAHLTPHLPRAPHLLDDPPGQVHPRRHQLARGVLPKPRVKGP